jgi:hypothetical protein
VTAGPLLSGQGAEQGTPPCFRAFLVQMAAALRPGGSAGMTANCSRRVLRPVLAAFLLCAGNSAAEDAPLPPNTVPCDAFIRREDGTWFAKRSVRFDIGNSKGVTLESAL